MSTHNDKLKTVRQTEKQGNKEKPEKQEEQKLCLIETVTLDILRSKKSDQKLWLSFQDIQDGFQNKPLLLDYWTKSDEFKIDLLKGLNALEMEGKIEKKIIEQESYFASIS
jgi:hypothetical protein